MNQEILQFSQAHAEPEWLSTRRQKAFESMEQLPLPYFDRVRFDRWELEKFSLKESEESSAVPDFTQISDHPLIVQVGSNTILEQMPSLLSEKNVIFTNFSAALEEIPEVIEKYFGSLISFDENRLIAASTAFFNSGVVLYVPDNVEIDEPLESILYQDSDSDVPFAKHLLIIAGKNSRLSYLERLRTFGSGNTKVTANLVVEVIAQEGAQMKFSAIDELGKNVTGFVTRRGLIADDATIDWSIGVMNDANIIADFDSELRGTGSHSNIKAVGISAGKQVQGVNTRVTNYGKNSVGHIMQNGVILDHGTLTFNGIGHIINGASGADAQQSSRVLMLSDTARGDANPILLIDENDVTAGHAASVGQLDPDDLYYLQSRGLDEDTAKRLVIRGFLGSVISSIPLKSVREEFIATVDRKLNINA